MPSSDTERSYVPFADPADRPRKSRATVRVIMINNDRTLLFEDSDPGVPGTSWWTTPVVVWTRERARFTRPSVRWPRKPATG